MSSAPPNLRLTIEGRLLDHLGVVSFRGTEEVSRLYRIDIDFTTDATEDQLEEILLRRAVSLSMVDGAEVARSFHGIAAEIQAHGVYQHGRRAYRLRLVPRMWLLKKRRTRRVWPEMSTLDIAAALFAEHGIAYRPRIARPLPRRAYCVQYDETDYAFLTRLFAEDGLFFTFDQPQKTGGSALVTSMGASEVVVVSDAADYYAPLDGGEDLRFERVQPTSAMHPRDDQITYFAPRAAVRPVGARVRGYDHRRPTVDLREEALHDPAAPAAIPAPLEASTVATFEGSYEETSSNRLRDKASTATLRLEALRRKARVVEATSFCRRLLPGRRFALHDHELPAFDGGYVVAHVEHEGYSAEVAPAGRALYQNRFSCVLATVPLRPRAPKGRPRATSETAIVVGPQGKEIHTDDLGRIRVRFFWDLSGRSAEQGTCWVRVAHLWAGTGWGAQFVPRIGMEVVVTYLDGDPDRPLVTGCVYNATHPPPFAVPASATVSGIRTASTPGGSGHNEIHFEDKAGAERIQVSAQRDLVEIVGNARTRTVRADERVTIQGSAQRTVGRDLEETVQGKVTERILGEHHVQVAKPYQAAYASRWLTTIAADAELRVGGNGTERVDGDHRVDVRGRRQVTVQGDVIEKTRGSHALVVGDPGSPRALTLHAEGVATLRGSQELILESPKAITLKVGKTLVRLTEHGIELHGDGVLVNGKAGSVAAGADGLTLRTKKKAEIAADTLHLHTTGDATSIVMKNEVKLAGSKILLNSPEQSKDPRPEDPPPVTRIVLHDQAGKPIPHERFLLRFDDKKERGGVLDEKGQTELHLDDKPGDVFIRFPDVLPVTMDAGLVWVPHVVQAGEYLDKIAHRLGFPGDLLWQAPKNAELRAQRPNPNLLAGGDVLWIPKEKARGEEPVDVGSENRFERRVPRVKVVVWLHRRDGSPLANEPCEVRGLGIQVTSGADGKVEIELPIHVREAELWIPKLQMSQPILVGDSDPADTEAGLRQRLTNLGYGGYHGFEDAPGDAILRFQKDHGLPATGVADPATLDALNKKHDRSGEA
ncbi:MAG: type VI secretion system tip protein TssI/VgrG [Minicystis sp.]